MRCGKEHHTSLSCLLADGHKGDHVALDMSKVWKGSRGLPVRWSEVVTGESCPVCGSLSTVRQERMLWCKRCGAKHKYGR